MSIEKHLVEHCSPTLASLKIANLFGVEFVCENELIENVALWNKWLNIKGVYVKVLRKEKNRALIYVYRKEKLDEILKNKNIKEFLTQYGYEKFDIENALHTLKKHLGESDKFPHEIGIFLGYPLEDVIGFIKNCGKNCLCCGYWKVYSDENNAKKLFCRYKKCRDIYMKLYQKGKSVSQLTVAA